MVSGTVQCAHLRWRESNDGEGAAQRTERTLETGKGAAHLRRTARQSKEMGPRDFTTT